jgi:hypothetical protein
MFAVMEHLPGFVSPGSGVSLTQEDRDCLAECRSRALYRGLLSAGGGVSVAMMAMRPPRATPLKVCAAIITGWVFAAPVFQRSGSMCVGDILRLNTELGAECRRVFGAHAPDSAFLQAAAGEVAAARARAGLPPIASDRTATRGLRSARAAPGPAGPAASAGSERESFDERDPFFEEELQNAKTERDLAERGSAGGSGGSNGRSAYGHGRDGHGRDGHGRDGRAGAGSHPPMDGASLEERARDLEFERETRRLEEERRRSGLRDARSDRWSSTRDGPEGSDDGYVQSAQGGWGASDSGNDRRVEIDRPRRGGGWWAADDGGRRAGSGWNDGGAERGGYPPHGGGRRGRSEDSGSGERRGSPRGHRLGDIEVRHPHRSWDDIRAGRGAPARERPEDSFEDGRGRPPRSW